MNVRTLVLAGAVASVLLLAGCAVDSGVVRMGKDTFMVSKQAATGFSGLGGLKADAMREAYAQCSTTGQSVQIISDKESHPPYIFGNYPRVDLTFQCVSGG
jgi:hypothetical protein